MEVVRDLVTGRSVEEGLLLECTANYGTTPNWIAVDCELSTSSNTPIQTVTKSLPKAAHASVHCMRFAVAQVIRVRLRATDADVVPFHE